MPATPSAAELVESAYDLRQPLDVWFESSVASFRARLDEGFGAFGLITNGYRVLHSCLDGADPFVVTVSRFAAPVFARRSPEGCHVTTSSEMLGISGHQRLTEPLRRRTSALDCCALVADDGAGLMLRFAAPRAGMDRPKAAERALASTVLPHFAAALRLRRTLTGLGFDTASAEAVYEPTGRCLNARGMGTDASARSLLRDAVLRAEKDRARAERCGEAAREALTGGRWSLVDRFDAHGRRFVIAYRNPSGVLDPRKLSPREREVAARIAQGQTQKAIGFELDISASTVANVAGAVVKKFALESTREIPLFWRDAGGTALALGRSDVVAVYGGRQNEPSPRLTPAERDVLSGIVKGKSNREIAIYRETSPRTVANQVASLLKKLGATSRYELSSRALFTE